MDPQTHQALQNFQAHFQQQQQQIADLERRNNSLAAHFRQEMSKAQERLDRQLTDLATIASSIRTSPGGSGNVRIEDLPGRRIPFDYITEIPIGDNTTSVRRGTLTISQEGPFIAVKRYMTFLSQHEFSVTTDSTTARFVGRSFGRFRPIHSASDLMDAQSPGTIISTPNPFVAGVTPGVAQLPGSMSNFRTMEFDGRVRVINAGSSFPRDNQPVPTSFWTTGINAPQELGCLDFYERGEVITFEVQPTHVNNPPAGNANGDNIFGVAGGWPFLEGQYDQHEGIVTPEAFTVDDDTVTPITSDPVTRLPSGILVIGLLGFRIQQPIGPVY